MRVLEEAGVLSFVGPVAAAILLVIPVLVHIVALLVFLELFVDGVARVIRDAAAAKDETGAMALISDFMEMMLILLATTIPNWLLYKVEKPNVYPRGMFNVYTTV